MVFSSVLSSSLMSQSPCASNTFMGRHEIIYTTDFERKKLGTIRAANFSQIGGRYPILGVICRLSRGGRMPVRRCAKAFR